MTAAATEELIKVGSIEVRFVVDEEDSSGSVTAFEVRVPPGSGVAPHSHPAFDEIVYGLAGMLTLTVDGRTADVAPGRSAFVPRGSIHSFENRGETDSQVLSVATPGLFRPAYFRELAAVIDRAAGRPPDPAALHEVMTRHSVTPAPMNGSPVGLIDAIEQAWHDGASLVSGLRAEQPRPPKRRPWLSRT